MLSTSLLAVVATFGTANSNPSYDVLVYGSTPSGIIAAVAAARHGATTALLSQRVHIGGVCTGGLGQTDIGSCSHEVIGGIPLEFFNRSANSYDVPQPRTPWNLEPHVAKEVYLAMLNESGVTLLEPAEVFSVTTDTEGNINNVVIKSITTVTGTTYAAKVFIDASYEGDLMARTQGVSYTWGREAGEQYNESGAGSHNGGGATDNDFPYINPYDATTGELLPLLDSTPPLYPAGQADKEIQAYNFRLCVTDNATIRIPFKKPDNYDPAQFELLRRFWLSWPNSTSPHKEAQAKVPSAILGAVPSSSGAKKYDANNCGYNPVHTDMIGGSWGYPEANYTERKQIWQAHVDYTKGFLWFMSSDSSVPPEVRTAHASDWGLCGDEFHETDHFPPQLYVREARRLVGDHVFTQNDVLNKTALGNMSIGMGCYGFDSHCEKRYPCDPSTNPACVEHNKTYVEVECSIIAGSGSPGVYQMPLTLLFPKRAEVTNLLVPVCNSASHVAYATVRMEPQFMILGHAAGVVAALTVTSRDDAAAVQDVDTAVVRALLSSDGALLDLPPPAPPAPLGYACVGGSGSGGDGGGDDVSEALRQPVCLITTSKHSYKSSTCDGHCPALDKDGWVLLKEHWKVSSDMLQATVTAVKGTFLKKSEAISSSLPSEDTRAVPYGTTERFSKPLASLDAVYWLGDLV